MTCERMLRKLVLSTADSWRACVTRLMVIGLVLLVCVSLHCARASSASTAWLDGAAATAARACGRVAAKLLHACGVKLTRATAGTTKSMTAPPSRLLNCFQDVCIP